MKRASVPVLSLLLLTLMACGPQGGSTVTTIEPDSNSGGDESLAGARGVFDTAVTDSIDATTGDNTDTKYIDVPARGSLNVRVRFHAPDVAGDVALMNEYGDVLNEQSVAAGTSEVTINDFPVLPGRYYVRVHASTGKSDYAIGQEFARDPSWMSSEDIAWRDAQLDEVRRLVSLGEFAEARALLNALKARFPENEEVDRLVIQEEDMVDEAEIEAAAAAAAAEEARRSRSRSRSRDRERDRETETETQTETPVEETPVEPETPAVRASIVTVRDRGAGAGTTLILTGCGTSSGLSEGDRGRVSGTSQRATITRITGGNSCEAESSGSPGEIRSAGHVEF